ncbi:hypothetical protein [Saccharopolyspora sp. NPDC050642]|uniref:hypothetical protein n=1 Tax=Saccharopolyspora sp. NPDC050642 TaxID=3157099 RepID=UPI003406F19C
MSSLAGQGNVDLGEQVTAWSVRAGCPQLSKWHGDFDAAPADRGQAHSERARFPAPLVISREIARQAVTTHSGPRPF